MNNQDQIKLAKAQKRVKDIKGFYSHLTVYLLVNISIFLATTSLLSSISSSTNALLSYLSTPVFWGVGLLIHAIFVFVPSVGFIKKWEARKMKELMGDDNRKY